VRALSVRYVERRGQLPTRSPLDSAGKRAAFGLFYAPLHMLTVDAAVAAVAAGARPTHIIDLGCGTGVCSAAWALRVPEPHPTIDGFDLHPWALEEARWNWRTLALRGRAVKLDAVTALERAVAGRAPLTPPARDY
jgi:methylase of polypeptide subunit release factors